MKLTPKQLKAVRLLVQTYFKGKKGEPYPITDSQCGIFASIIRKEFKYVWLTAPTRYGKSEILALALIYLASIEKLKIPIVAGSTEKANKIMEYILEHVGDHPDLYNALINLEGLESIDKLKISVAKDKLRWSHGGWIYITSVNSRQVNLEGEGVVGEGGDVVVLEEAGLIKSKDQFSKIVRMTEGEWGKLVMSGNCIEGSVFENGYNSPLYHKVRIDLATAVKEGRYNYLELQNKRSQTTAKDWKRYYKCEFPEANEFSYFKPKQYGTLPAELKYYGSLDPALGESKNNETPKGSLVGINVLGKDVNGQIYQVESIGEIMSPDETIRRIFNMPYKFERFGIEAVQFQRYFIKMIDRQSKQEGRYIPFVGLEAKGKKEERIEAMEPFINTGMILFRGDDILWEHMADYPRCKLDVLDSLEIGLYLMGVTRQNQKTNTRRISF